MEQFDSNMATSMIEDALQAVGDPVGRGIAIGLCSAFYLCGLLKPAEWEKYQERILEGSSGETAARDPAGQPPVPDHSTILDYSIFPGYAGPPATTPHAKTRSN